jgi:hypothetical protein
MAVCRVVARPANTAKTPADRHVDCLLHEPRGLLLPKGLLDHTRVLSLLKNLKAEQVAQENVG